MQCAFTTMNELPVPFRKGLPSLVPFSACLMVAALWLLQNIQIPLTDDPSAVRKYAEEVESLKRKVGSYSMAAVLAFIEGLRCPSMSIISMSVNIKQASDAAAYLVLAQAVEAFQAR